MRPPEGRETWEVVGRLGYRTPETCGRLLGAELILRPEPMGFSEMCGSCDEEEAPGKLGVGVAPSGVVVKTIGGCWWMAPRTSEGGAGNLFWAMWPL